MSETPSTSAQQIAYIAEKIMGYTWYVQKTGKPFDVVMWKKKEGGQPMKFDPLKDWNHWRPVELKIMEDETLWVHYVTDLVIACSVDTDYAMMSYAYTDLPARVAALISAHKHLYSQPDDEQ